MLGTLVGAAGGLDAQPETIMGRFAHAALGALAGLAVAAATGAAQAQSGSPGAAPPPGSSQAAPAAGSGSDGGADPAQSGGQPAGVDRQGAAEPEADRPVPGCPARNNKLDLIV